jgi:hypothetical protein
MRSTQVVLGVVIVGGLLAFLAWNGGADGDAEGTTTVASGKPALNRNQATDTKGLSPKAQEREEAATQLVSKLGAAARTGDVGQAKSLESKLRKEAWDSLAARSWALQAGRALAAAAVDESDGTRRIRGFDRARRLLSRGVFLPRMFTAAGEPTPERATLIQQIQKLNRAVMRWSPGLPGVTTPFVVPSGIRPVQIVFRRDIAAPGADPLPMGPNAVMYWNQGNLDPRRIRAGSRFLLPLEELTLQVHMRYFRAAVFIGDWFVKEWQVGVGTDETPTPTGVFEVHSKEENPDWWSPGGKLIPFGDKDNALGSRWIALQGESLPLSRGIGIHGTNEPKTVGSRCSNGCIRLHNEHVNELFWWLRTGNGGGRASRIIVTE